MPVSGASVSNPVSLDRRSSVVLTFFAAYTGATQPAAPAPQSIVTDGVATWSAWELVENNVAGGATITIQGSFDNTNFYPVMYIARVTAGTTSNTNTLVAATFAVSQNSRNVLVIQDYYPYMKALVTANASNASLTAKYYGLP